MDDNDDDEGTSILIEEENFKLEPSIEQIITIEDINLTTKDLVPYVIEEYVKISHEETEASHPSVGTADYFYKQLCNAKVCFLCTSDAENTSLKTHFLPNAFAWMHFHKGCLSGNLPT